tara:strand:+ start:1488 stop:2330 length:843 start_codon:yes stop_codon:yes gene_type:complete
MKSIGIIGAGRWGRNIARSFSKKRNVKRVVTSGNTSNLDQIKDICPGIQVSSLEQLAADDDIDSVIIAVPIPSLSQVAATCLSRNKNVFLEKPAATSVADLKKVKDVSAGKVCFVNYLYLADPAYESFKNALSKTKVKSASFTWEKWGSFNNDILLNLASHDLSILFDTFQSGTVTSLKTDVQDDRCHISFYLDEVSVEINIDRQHRTRNKSVTYETDRGLFMWTPGHFAHEDVEVSTNAASMLLDLQRDNFLAMVDKGECYNNLSLSSRILDFLDGISQ